METSYKIKSVELETVCGITSTFPENDKIEIAFAGKSNVGKSSLINALVNRKALARTSAQPGKTQTINFYKVNDEVYFVDLPGYGYAKVSEEVKAKWGKLIERYLNESEMLKAVFLLVDIRHDPTQDDVAMAQYFRQMDIPFTVVATKADKISRGARMKHIAPICRALLVQPWEVIPYSSEDGFGRDKVLELIEDVLYEEIPEEEAAQADPQA